MVIHVPILVGAYQVQPLSTALHLGAAFGRKLGNNNPTNESGKLQGAEAIDKFKELVDHQSACMFLTDTPN